MTGKFRPREGDAHDIYDVASLGKGIKRTSRTTKELTVKQAENYLKVEEFVGDRPLSSKHVEYLADAMVRGTFFWEHVNIILCKCKEPCQGHPAGTVFRMNGQHTCWARMEAGNSMNGARTPIYEERWTAETPYDVRMLYSSLDRHLVRSHGNILVAYLKGSEGFEDLSPSTIKLLGSGFRMWKWSGRGERSKYDADAVAYLMATEDAELTLKVADFVQTHLRSHSPETAPFRKAAVLGAMHATFRKSAQASEEFWEPVCIGVGMSRQHDPRLKLRGELQRTSQKKSATGSGTMVRDVEEIYRLCISAWNAWRVGQDLRQMKVTKTRIAAK